MALLVDYSSEQEWLELRAKNINSTESAALFGLSPYLSEFELHHQKKSGIVEFTSSERVEAGKILEPAIAEFALKKLDCLGEPLKVYAVDPAARMGSSFDWRITSGMFEGWLLEIKNVDRLVYMSDWLDDEAPDHIEVQVQHQAHIMQCPGVVIAALVGGNEIKLIYRERCERTGAGIEAAVKKFWKRFDEGGEPEPNFNVDADFIAKLNSDGSGQALDMSGDSRMAMLLAEYHHLSSACSAAENAKKAKKAEILTAVGDASKVYADGFTLSCGNTKASPGTLVTPDMVGTYVGGRSSFRMFRVTEKSTKK